MTGKLSISKKWPRIIVLCALFFGLLTVMPYKAGATNVLYQQLDNSGSYSTAPNGSAVIGSFTTTQPIVISTAGSMSFQIRNDTGGSFCQGNGAFSIEVSNNPVTNSGEFHVSQFTTINGSFVSVNKPLEQNAFNFPYTMPAGTYYLKLFTSCGGGAMTVKTDSSNTNLYGVISDDGNSENILSLNGKSGFISISPTNGSTTANTVNLSVTYYINPTDVRNLFCDSLSSDCQQLNVNWYLGNMDNNSPSKDFTYPAFPGFILTASTTQTLDNGFWGGTIAVNNGSVNVISTSTAFTVNTSRLSGSTTAAIIGQNFGTSTLDVSCSFSNVPACINSWVTMTPSQLQDINDRMTVALFAKVPFSYIVRMNTLLRGSSTSTLPSLTYTFASTSVLAGQTISFNPWVYGYDSTSSPLRQIKDPTSGKDVWQILETPISYAIYFALIVMIINDLTHVHVANKHQL